MNHKKLKVEQLIKISRFTFCKKKKIHQMDNSNIFLNYHKKTGVVRAETAFKIVLLFLAKFSHHNYLLLFLNLSYQ